MLVWEENSEYKLEAVGNDNNVSYSAIISGDYWYYGYEQHTQVTIYKSLNIDKEDYSLSIIAQISCKDDDERLKAFSEAKRVIISDYRKDKLSKINKNEQ